MDRRHFLESSSTIAASALLARVGLPRAEPPMIGIQGGAVSFVDEGTERVLDNLQRLASVNTIFLATFTYGRGIGGRQPRGSALPDHGKQEYDDNFRGGQFATPHPQYYRKSSIAPEKAPDHGSYDVLADVLPAARKRGMKVICWFEDVIGANVPGFDQAREVTLTGRPSTFACSRNPSTRAFWLGMVEDYLRSYDVDGLMWGSERQGPLGNAIVANHGGQGAGGGIACFCQYCLAAGKAIGIDTERAKAGYLALATWVSATRDKRPVDGAFVTFWRLLTKYPEIMAWERLWNEALNDTYRDMYRLAHSIAPGKGIGWHVWHNNSFSPFYRAEQDYADFARYSDFLKVVIYNLCGGERLAQYVRSVQRSVFADFTPAQVLDFTYGVQQYRDKSLEQLAAEGLGPDYVLRETKRAVASAGPNMKIWPGIDIDIPTAATSKKTTPDDVYLAVKAAFEGGGHGVLLSRKYSEMRLDNLGGAGRALRELKLGMRILVAIALLAGSLGAQQAPFNKQRIVFKSGSLSLVGYVYHPDGAGPFPTVVWNHGSEKNPAARQFDGVARIFVPAGFAVFAPMRRGHGDSEGRYIVDSLNLLRERADGSAIPAAVHLLEGEQLDDQLAGLAFARTMPFVDQHKLVVAGCSYGGIQTLLAAERKVGFVAALPISPAAQSWAGNPLLRDRLKRAVDAIDIPVLLIAPPKDASLEPPRELGDEAKRAKKTAFTVKIYPPTMPDSEQTHCFGGVAGFHNWGADAVKFFNTALGR